MLRYVARSRRPPSLSKKNQSYGKRFARHRRNRRASRDRSRSVSLTIRQTLASRALDGKVRTFPIVDAKGDTVGITEVEF
jgi:hypothetical protein